MSLTLSRLYTRTIGIFFTLVVITLIADYFNFGFRAETLHKILHVTLGIFIIVYGWNNKLWWKYFPLINGLFFTYIALFGWIFPDFANLDAFNRLDTILHSIVGLSGLVISLIEKNS